MDYKIVFGTSYHISKGRMDMKLLIYRYGSICEPDIIEGFQELGFEI